jgi:hypothetical protein
MTRTIAIVSAAFLLAACGEADQTLGGVKSDAPAHGGTGKAYVESGWKPGDKGSWESQLKARGQYGQNEYNRVN